MTREAPAATAAATVPDRRAVRCVRHGRGWRIEAGRRSAVVEHSVGMLHLAVLIANPCCEIPAADLVAGVAALGSSGGGSRAGRAAGRAVETEQPLLDAAAVRQYRERVEQLRARIAELDSRGERERAASARVEHGWLVAELARTVGVGGRTRAFPTGSERARIAVGKAIRRALGRISEADAAIGEQLRQSIYTGVRCCYRPV
jgi:hypothetical protein